MSGFGYKNINLAHREFINGGEILKTLAKENDVNFLASNTFYQDTDKPFTEPFQIQIVKAKDENGLPFKSISLGIIGLCDDRGMLFSKRLKEPMLYCKDPIEVAKELVPKVNKKADLVVLLYNGNYKKLKDILETVPDIDIAIMGGQYYLVNPRDKFDAIVASSVSMGKYGSILTVTLDSKKNILDHNSEKLPLKEDMVDDLEMLKLLDNFDKELEKLQLDQINSVKLKSRN